MCYIKSQKVDMCTKKLKGPGGTETLKFVSPCDTGY